MSDLKGRTGLKRPVGPAAAAHIRPATGQLVAAAAADDVQVERGRGGKSVEDVGGKSELAST